MSRTTRLVILAACSVLAVGCSFVMVAAPVPVVRPAESFAPVKAEALRLANEYGASNVLLVFDVDNTLLAMNQGLGSDPWFAWQAVLDETDERYIGPFPQLLRVQGLLYAISSMRPTYPEQPDVVRQLQSEHFTTLLLTSRGFNFRDATRRELLSNGYDFRESTLEPKEGFAGVYCPYRLDEIEQAGISLEEANLWLRDDRSGGLKKARAVTYKGGIYMTAGQNKGVMLRMLLHKAGHADAFKAILFVDDTKKHTGDVVNAFKSNRNVEVVVFHYSGERAQVEAFESDDSGEKKRAHEAWQQLSGTLSDVTRSTLASPLLSPPDCEATRGSSAMGQSDE